MKKTALIYLMTAFAFVMSGCSLIFEEPSTLILPPASSEAQFTERMLIKRFLSNDEHLEVPENMEHPAAFVNLDVDGDKANEKLVFWSKRNGYEVGAMLLKEDESGEWTAIDQIHQYGSGIDYFKLLDIDKDGKQEACIGADIGGYNVLYIYRLGEEGLTEIDQINYSKLEIVDTNGDGTHVMLCALNDGNETTPTTTLFKYELDKEIKCVYQEKFDGSCVDLKFGKVSKDKQGLYFVRTGDYSNFNVELLLPNKKDGFDEQLLTRVVNLSAANGSISVIGDATGDGILDVRTAIKPIDTGRHNNSDYVKAWKSWDGQNSLEYVYGVFENNTDGYTFVLPNGCLEQLRYQFITEKGSNQVRFYDGANAEPALILYAQSAEEAEKTKTKEGIISLGTSPSHQRSYFALCNVNTLANRPLNGTIVKEAFQIEGGQ